MNTTHTSRQGQWFVLAAAIFWGTTGTAQAFAPEGYNPMVVGALRLAIGGMAQLGFAMMRGVLHCRAPWPVLPVFLAATGVALYQLCFFMGVFQTGVAVGTMITMGSAPIFGGILGFLVRKEKPDFLWGLATVLAIAGCMLLVSADGAQLTVQASGVLWALGAGAAYSLYAVSVKGLLELHATDAVTAVIFCVGTLILSPVFFTINPDWLFQTRSFAVVLYLGVLATVLPYSCFARGLRLIPTATAVTITLAEPLTASLLGVVVLGEHLTPRALMGIGLIFCGLALLSFDIKKQSRRGR